MWRVNCRALRMQKLQFGFQVWREKNTQTQRHRNIEKHAKKHKFRFWALNVACELRKGRTGLHRI